MELKIKKMRQNAKTPAYATAGAAGMDLFAALDVPVSIGPGERAMIPTGIAISLESEQYVALVFARSGLASKMGITLSNCVGVIDSDYRGEILVSLINQSRDEYIVKEGDRIAQMSVMPVVSCQITECDELDETTRGEGGHGSTGR